MPVETEGEASPLVAEAMAIGLAADESTTTSVTEPAAAGPNVGSYEAFMSSFGSPQRWAGAG